MNTLIDQQLVTGFYEIIQNSKSILIVPHTNPDGDAIGSCLALIGILENMHKEAKIIIPNEFP